MSLDVVALSFIEIEYRVIPREDDLPP
jgi:hypothetical protein